MDMSEFPDIDIDHLLDGSAPLEDGFLAPYRQIATPKVNAKTKEKRIRLAERVAQSDELLRQVKQLKIQNKQLADLQRTAQEVTDLYQKERQQRVELQKQSQQLGERCAELEKELDAQVINCENLQEEMQTKALPVDAKEVLAILMQLEQRLGDDAGLVRRDQNIVKKLKDYCKTANISLPTPKSPSPRTKRRSQGTQTNPEAVQEKPTQSSVAVQVERLVETRDTGTQHKNHTTTRGTTTASFIRKHDVGTSFPEPKPLPNVRQILDEMLSWRDAPLRPLSPLCDLLPEVAATVSVATCTTLCNVHREIDFLSELPPHIKVSASRPPSRTMLDSVKEEARSSRELAKELLNFLPQNQSCLTNLPPQAFEELWQVFGQMVLALLQRRSNPALATPPTVSQADFTSWLYELYEDTQQEKTSAGKRDFATGTDSMDVGTDPIVASPNISHGGDVTPIKLPLKPKERKRERKSKKRKAAASLIKPIPKRKCQEMEPAVEPAEEQKIPKEPEESAIQFLSNLNTFNMANCDNLDMELNEEEMYLLQLTSQAAVQEEAKKSDDFQSGECENQSVVQEERESSLKDDFELAPKGNTKETENSVGITCKEAGNQTEVRKSLESLPDLSPEETNPSDFPVIKRSACLELKKKPRKMVNMTSLPDLLIEKPSLPEQKQEEIRTISSLPDLCLEEANPSDPSLSRACLELKTKPEEMGNFTSLPDLSSEGTNPDLSSIELEPEGKANIASLPDLSPNLPDLSPNPPHLPLNGSVSDKISTLCEEQELESDLNSAKELSLDKGQPALPETAEETDQYFYSSDSDSDADENMTQREPSNEVSCCTNAYLFGSDSDMESEASEDQLSKAETEWSPIESEEEFNEGELESGKQQLPKEDQIESEEEFNKSSFKLLEPSEEQLPKKDNGLDPIESEEEFNEGLPKEDTELESEEELSKSDSESSEEQLPKEETKLDPIESEEEFSEEQLPKEVTELDPIELEKELSKSESESSKEQLSKEETKLKPIESEEEFKESDTESCQKLLLEDTELDAIESEEEFAQSKSESSEEQVPKEVNEWSPIESEEELPNVEDYSDGIKEPVAKEQIPTDLDICKESEDKPERMELELKEEQALRSKISDLPQLVPSTENPVAQPALVPIKSPILAFLATQPSSPSLNSGDESEDDQKLVMDVATSPSVSSVDSPLSATAKRRRTLSDVKTPPTPGEGRLTRQRAKKLLMEQSTSTESGVSLAEQIRRQLKQAINRSEPLKGVGESQPKPSHRCIEDSPASPSTEPPEEEVEFITEIPLEQAVSAQDERGEPKSILQHVIDQYQADPKLTQQRRKTLGKQQQQLCASIGKYLKESLELESLSLEVYRLTKDEAVIVNALVVVISQIGTEGNPLERLLEALKYFKFTQRFLAELEERLFRNTQEKPALEVTMKYVKLYLAAVSQQAVSEGYANPSRLLLAKLLYHYDRDMPPLVLEVLRHFPTVLPHREQRDYDHSDPLITVIKHLLMGRTYDMQDPDGAERLLLSKLRFEYHFQPFEPTRQQVLENLVEKLKAGRLEHLPYAFALFCRRSPQAKFVELVVTEHLMPLATSYCDLAAQQDAYDARLVVLLQCISLVLKPLPLETDIHAFVGLIKRLIVAVPRPGVQQAAVQACLRLQRFGFQTVSDALLNYRPQYPLEPLTRAMIRCFAGRRKQYRSGRK